MKEMPFYTLCTTTFHERLHWT